MNSPHVGSDRERILIRAKINRPQLPAGLIVCPSLLERLDGGFGPACHSDLRIHANRAVRALIPQFSAGVCKNKKKQAVQKNSKSEV